MFRFKVENTGISSSGTLIYWSEDCAFDSKSRRPSGFTVLVDTLKIRFDSSSMKARHVEGFFAWRKEGEKPLSLPNIIKGDLVKLADQKILSDFEHNCSNGIDKTIQRLPGCDVWEKTFDPISGWFCLGDKNTLNDDIAVEFFTNSVAVVDKDGQLKSVWLKPVFMSRKLFTLARLKLMM